MLGLHAALTHSCLVCPTAGLSVTETINPGIHSLDQAFPTDEPCVFMAEFEGLRAASPQAGLICTFGADPAGPKASLGVRNGGRFIIRCGENSSINTGEPSYRRIKNANNDIFGNGVLVWAFSKKNNTTTQWIPEVWWNGRNINAYSNGAEGSIVTPHWADSLVVDYLIEPLVRPAGEVNAVVSYTAASVLKVYAQQEPRRSG